VELLSIGAFAKAARLSPKALRLYDDLGLLLPARVDPVTGYRFYAPDQLERARLVAWLRRLGMPLARIQQVGARMDAADEAGAARKIRAYWAQVEAETAARRDLATFLVDHLTRKEHPPMNPPHTLRYAAASDTGLVRAGNQDAVYAGSHLLAVADGFGPTGAPASAAAIEALRHLDAEALPAGNILNALRDAVEEAGRAVGDTASPSSPEQAGTTLTAMLWTGTHLALVHIGDSRAYLLRDGELFRITHDHTLVQSMVDDGRLTEDEAASHPDRALLLRALLPDGTRPAVDLRLQSPQPGDRYLLCSDGLSAVADRDELRRALAGADDPGAATRALVAVANAAGGPDNVSCVVADVVSAAA
jgi:protein phosphatase